MSAKKSRLGKGFNALFGEKDKPAGAEELPLASIITNAGQPRRYFDEEALQDMAASIKKHGLIQPLVVRRKGISYELIAGERRYRAAKIAGLAAVPVVIRDYDDKQSAEIALIENLQREDLNPLEESEAYDRLMREYGFTQEDMADTVGKSRPYIANMVRLLALPEEVRQLLAEKKLTAGQARPLLSLSTEAEKIQMARRIIEKGLSARQIEALVKEVPKKVKKQTPRKEEAYFQSLEEELKKAVGASVHIKTGRGKKKYCGTIAISFPNEKEFERLIRFLKQLDEE